MRSIHADAPEMISVGQYFFGACYQIHRQLVCTVQHRRHEGHPKCFNMQLLPPFTIFMMYVYTYMYTCISVSMYMYVVGLEQILDNY